MRRIWRRCTTSLVILAVGLIAAACGGARSPSVVAPSSSIPTTTTTTTLPRSQTIPSTKVAGAQSFLGSILRVPVITPTVGTIELPPPPTGFGESLPSTLVAYRQFGSGPNLLLVMGQHGTMTWWDPQLLSLLAAHFTVTIFDLPGVGYSQSPPAPPTLDSYADATAGLVLALGLGTNGVSILGWGLGGDVALDAEARHPHLVTSLTLVDAPAPGPLNVRRAATSAAFSSLEATTVGLSQLMFPPTQNDVRTAWLQRIGQVSPDDITAGAVLDQARIAASIQHDVKLAHGLHGVDVPVHVITGSDDLLVPKVNAIRLARSIPHSSLLELADAGYASMITNQTQFITELTTQAK